MEIWRNVKGNWCTYWVSSLGNVKRTGKNKGKLISIRKKRRHINLYTEFGQSVNLRVSQLVAIAFLGHKLDDSNMVIDHIDGNSKNDNVDNLQIITRGENISKYFSGNTLHIKKQEIVKLNCDHYFISID